MPNTQQEPVPKSAVDEELEDLSTKKQLVKGIHSWHVFGDFRSTSTVKLDNLGSDHHKIVYLYLTCWTLRVICTALKQRFLLY